MKKRVLWLLAVTCILILSLVLSACGGNTPATTKTTTQSQTTTQTTTATTKATTQTTTVATSAASTATTTSKATTASQSAGTPRSGGILRIGDFRISNFIGNPATINQGYAKRQAVPALENLLAIDASGKTVPWLATDWKVDPTAMTITLTLRPGVMFHDMTPCNAAAVKWNIDNCVSKKQTGTPLIKSVEAVNDSTVRINLSQWDNTILDTLGYSYLGMMISPTAYQKNGGELWANNTPVGTGPFVFEAWLKEVTISFSKFQSYWQTGKPYLDRIENVIIIDQTVGLLNFKRGNTDELLEPLSTDLNTLRKTYPVTELPYAAFGSIRAGAIYDSADPNSPFKDVRVRQAFQLAVDQEKINQAVFGGNGQPEYQFISKDSWGYNPDIVGYKYNPDKARALLADAGIAAGTIKTNYIYQNIPEDEAAATAVKDFEKAIGIDVTLVSSSAAQLNNWRLKWDGLVKIGAIPYPDCGAAFRDRYIGIDARYFVEMTVPADYKAAVLSAVTAPDFATKQKFVWQAGQLFTDKYCLGFCLPSSPTASVDQLWTHGTGMYKFASDGIWTPQDAWKDAGH